MFFLQKGDVSEATSFLQVLVANTLDCLHIVSVFWLLLFLCVFCFVLALLLLVVLKSKFVCSGCCFIFLFVLFVF